MKPYIQKQYRDNLFTQVYVGSEKSIKKLDETWGMEAAMKSWDRVFTEWEKLR